MAAPVRYFARYGRPFRRESRIRATPQRRQRSASCAWLRRFERRLRPCEPALMEDQRVAARPFDRHDFADEHDMIAGGMAGVMTAFEPGDAAVDQRRVRPAQSMRNAREAIRMGTRKAPRQVRLFG